MKKNLIIGLLFVLGLCQSSLFSIAVMNKSSDKMYVCIFWGDSSNDFGWVKPGKCFRYRSGVDKNQVYACKSSLGAPFKCVDKKLHNTSQYYADGDDSYHVSDDDMLFFTGSSLYTDNSKDANKIC